MISSSVMAQTQHTAAGLLDDAASAQLQQPNMLQLWISKVKPRMKGYTRKLALRQLNRRVIARVARRFTIGIPVLGKPSCICNACKVTAAYHQVHCLASSVVLQASTLCKCCGCS
jgi:hypothetical protein